MTAIRIGLALTAVLLVAVIAACGGGDNATSTPTPTPTQVPYEQLPIPDPWELHVAAADGSGDTTVYIDDRTNNFAWSPDGKELALTSGTADSSSVKIVGLDGKVRAGATHAGYPGPVVWSPDGKWVATTFSVSATYVVTAISSDGATQKELITTSSGTYAWTAGWLPDGELLVGETTTGVDGSHLLAFDVESGVSRSLSDLSIQGGYSGAPAVSPDGRLLAVSVELAEKGCGTADTGSSIWTIDLQSGATTQVSPGGYCGGGGIIWSPDGTQIAFSAINTAQDSGLYVTDVATHQARQLARGLENVAAWLDNGTILADQLFCTGCDGGGPPQLIAFDSTSGESHQVLGAVPSSVSARGQIVAADGSIKTVDVSGAEVRSLAPMETGWQYGSLTWSPDEKNVAYLRYHATGYHFYEVKAEGSDFSLLASSPDQSSLSPDGSRLAYLVQTPTADGKASAELWLANADGTNAVDVGVPLVVGFSWSPDSSRLLFQADDEPKGVASPYVVSADGSGVRKIETTSPAIIGNLPAVWAPNGKLAAFGEGDIDVVNVDTGEVWWLGQSLAKGASLSWSADSKQVIYSRERSAGPGSEFVIAQADGSGSTTILSDSQEKNAPTFSPDGKQIAFLSAGTGKNTQVIVANVDGSGEKVIGEGGLLGSSVVWSPDGKWIAMGMGLDSGSGLFLFAPDGSAKRQITRGGSYSDISWADNDHVRFTTYQGGL